MSDLQNNPPPPKKRTGLAWFFGGLGLAILLLVLLCCGGVAVGVGTVWYQAKSSMDFKKALETTQPVKYSGVAMKKPELDAAYNRCVDAREEVVAGKIAKLTLTDVEWMNLVQEWLKNNPNAQVGGLDLVARQGGIKGKISVEDPEQVGRWLTFDADMDLAVNGDNLTFNLKSLQDPAGNDAPLLAHTFVGEMFRAGCLMGFDEVKNNRKAGNKQQQNVTTIQPTSRLYGLKSLAFTPGTVTVEIDPARVKSHNAALGKPADAPLFEGDDDKAPAPDAAP